VQSLKGFPLSEGGMRQHMRPNPGPSALWIHLPRRRGTRSRPPASAASLRCAHKQKGTWKTANLELAGSIHEQAFLKAEVNCRHLQHR